mgnify:CR=1 FL=1
MTQRLCVSKPTHNINIKAKLKNSNLSYKICVSLALDHFGNTLEICTTGVASNDLIKTIQKLGKIFFWKAAIKPGRPLAIGKIGHTFMICLPGNPVSVHLLYGMIVKPFLEFLCGAPLIQPRGIKATAMFSMKKKNQRMEWLRVNIIKNSENCRISTSEP